MFHAVDTPCTHPVEYLEWTTQSNTEHTLISLCAKCAGFHMYTQKYTHTDTGRATFTQTQRRTWVMAPKLALRCTLIYPPTRPPFLGGGHLGVICLFLKVSKHWGESPLTLLKKVGIPISRRPTSHSSHRWWRNIPTIKKLFYNTMMKTFFCFVCLTVIHRCTFLGFFSIFAPFFSAVISPICFSFCLFLLYSCAFGPCPPRFDTLHLACQQRWHMYPFIHPCLYC